MKISLYLLLDRLRKYESKCDIKFGERTIERVRISKADGIAGWDGGTLYLIPEDSVAEGRRNGVLMQCCDDTVFIFSDNEEDVYNDVFKAMELYNDIEQRAFAHISNDGDLQGLLTILQEGIYHNVFMVNKMFYIMATAGSVGYADDNKELAEATLSERHLPLDVTDKVLNGNYLDDRKRGPVRFHPKPMPRGGVYRNLFLNSPDSIGRLLFPEDFDELSPGEMQFADIMGDIVEQWFMRSKRLEPMTIPAALNMLLDDSLSEDFDMPLFLTALKWDNEAAKEFICVRTLSHSSQSNYFALGLFCEYFGECHPFRYREDICLIHTVEKYNEHFYEKLGGYLDKLNACAGVGYAFSSVYDMKLRYQQASVALELGKKERGDISFCKDYQLDYMLKVLRENLQISLSTGSLQLLRDYDEQHNTFYYKTLFIYLSQERNQSLSAQILNIHRNTLLQRIHRIEEIVNIDLESPENRFLLLLYYYLADNVADGDG